MAAWTRVLVVAALVAGSSAGLQAKGPTVRLTVSGPGLSASVPITDQQILSVSNVWAGAFIGAPAEAPDSALPSYTVAFDVELPAWMKAGVRRMYAVHVVKDVKNGGLWLYLPGRGDSDYGLNVGTMLREGQDGHWHRANAAWGEAVAKYLP